MSEGLRTALRQEGERAPMPRVDGDLWRRGRRRRWLRKIGSGATGLLVVAIVVFAPRLMTGGGGLQVVDDGHRSGSLGKQYPWQMSFEQSPNGPVTGIFTHDETVYGEPTGVIVGRDGSYRLFYLAPGSTIGIVSPDGRHLARWGELVDLINAEKISIEASPLAWSADSRQLLLTINNDDQAITYGPDGPSNPSKPDDVVIYNLASGARKTLLTIDADTPAGAFSPDGQRVAVTVGRSDGPQQLLIVDVATGKTTLSIPLAGEQKLAGAAAWTPDGRSVVLMASAGCAWLTCFDGQLQSWHMQYLDPATGKITDEVIAGRPGDPRELAGWRDQDPVFAVSDGFPSGLRLTVAKPDGSQSVLLTTSEGTRDLTVPRELVEHRDFGTFTANPLAAQPWAYACLLVILLVVVSIVAIVWRRRRNS